MTSGIYYYKLVSPYSDDITKNCKLSINEIDSNFFNLKSADIKSAEFIREDKTLILTRNDGEKFIVPLKDVAYNLDVKTGCTPSGASITISYDCVDGKKSVTFGNILTYENLKEIIGSDILTKVITDETLKGDGTVNSPLGLRGVEKTGMYAPVEKVYDLTDGSKLPSVAKLGTRYLTKEYVSDYGYLYNGEGLKKIEKKLSDAESEWRVPSKADWDALLNSIEACEYRNHDSAKCHVELGKEAGKFLKSECSWVGQPVCECSNTKPYTSCTTSHQEEGYVEDESQDTPQEKPQSNSGVDKYGMTILPSGMASYNTYFDRFEPSGFREQAYYWTTTQIAEDQDNYVKEFIFDKGGVYQVAECPLPYYSVRLVKDYDGSNFRSSEYIDGVLYNAILFPQSKQVWLATNYANKEGFVKIGEGEVPEIADVNNGTDINERKVELFINEWNGECWDRKTLKDGDTIVVNNPCFDSGSGTTTEVCWKDETGVTHCVEVEIPKVAQSNIEYRVYSDDECDKILVNTDDLVVERVINIIVPMLEKERQERIEADEELWDALNEEISARTEADDELWEALNEEVSARTEADEELWDTLNEEISARTEADEILNEKIEQEIADREAADELLNERIDDEIARAISAETALDEKIEAEIERATEREDKIEEKLDDEIERATQKENEIDGQLIDWSKNPFTLNAAENVMSSEENLILETKDGNEEHYIKINFDGNFGEF